MVRLTQIKQSRGVADRSARARLARVALGLVSLAIYIALALLQVQNNDDPARQGRAYNIERTAMASAISHIVYGAPWGSVTPAYLMNSRDLQTLSK
jgi:hypothetical protein